MSFAHDGSETTAASFEVVGGGRQRGRLGAGGADLQLHGHAGQRPPVLTGDLTATVAEGGSYTLTASDLGFTRPGRHASGVTFTVSNQVNGTVKVNGVAATASPASSWPLAW